MNLKGTYASRDELALLLSTKLRTALPMIFFMIGYCGIFVLVEKWNRLHYTVIHMALDDAIPFCEVFIIPYMLWFLYVMAFTIFILFADEDGFRRVSTLLMLGMGLFLAVSIVFPNIHFLRPEVMPRDNVFTRLVQFIYSSDTPTNLTPSIHVYNSLAIMIGTAHTRIRPFDRKLARILSYGLGFSIILSTMFIKQHSVSDVLVAFALMAVAYVAVYRFNFTFYRRRSRKSAFRSVFNS